MTKNELWQALLERYPDFKNEEHIVKLRARGLRRLIDQAWDEGHAKVLENSKELKPMYGEDNPFLNFFKGFSSK